MERFTYLRTSAILTAAVAALVAAGGAACADPADTSGDTVIASRADAALDDALKKLVAMPGGPPGVIAIVQREGSRKVHRAGVANLSNGRPLRADDHMRIASVAKAFSGAVALSLVSKGTLSLDDTIGEHLPDLPVAWSDVTLRQLLGHTSGLPDFSKNKRFQAAVQASPQKA